MTPPLTRVARCVWAKSWPQGSLEVEGWLPLWRHLQDAAAVAGRLWDRWLPVSLRRQIARACGGDDAGRTLLVLVAGVHDIGKATPAFAVQVDRLRDQMVRAGLPMPHTLPERRDLPHGLAGQIVLERWLELRHGWPLEAASGLGSVVGGHHGIPPARHELNRGRRNPELLGDGPWRVVQDDLLEHMAQHVGADRYLVTTVWHRLPRSVLALLLGLVVVADWLASNQDLFPLAGVEGADFLPQPTGEDRERLEEAWAVVDLPRPWGATGVEAGAAEILQARFDLPEGATVRPVQAAAVEAARTMDAEGILVIEAPMGEGKTEAALAAAEILAARSGAGGLLVALPTQATSDAMFARVMRWLARAPGQGAPDVERPVVPDSGGGARRSVYLAHGKAWLNPDFSRVPRGRTRTGDLGRDERGGGAVYVDAWMTGRRKGVLADFVVGTIDQVLFGALQSRHVALRHLALARKVVVLDEVHSFDAYTNVYLERALEWLGAYRVPVVALSATLPPKLRDRLVDAYRRGRATGTGPGRRDRRRGRPRPVTAEVPPSIPLTRSAVDRPTASSRVTALTDGVAVGEDVIGPSRSRRVVIETAADDDVARVLHDALRDGGCALVVRNTVTRAQETFRDLREVFGPDVVLLHSRFLAKDRKLREQWLVERLGPPPTSGRGARPERLVVVATQVMEQSLDVDFDLLITDLAPTDLLLQRVGRLHRHDRPADHRPSRTREPRAVVVGVDDWGAQPPTFPRGCSQVYGPYLLLRAAAQVLARTTSGQGIRLPQDIAPLVHAAYGMQPLGPDEWRSAMEEAHHKAQSERLVREIRARTFLLGPPAEDRVGLIGWLDGSIGEAEAQGRAQVRDADDAFEVLVVQRDAGGQWRLPGRRGAGVDGELLEMREVPPVAKRRALAGTAVRLPAWLAAGELGDQVLDQLEENVVDAWQDSPDLAGQLVLPLDDGGRAYLAGCEVVYDEDLGLRVGRPRRE
ncbi:CRISPR-associated helicase Cas3' [Isoptericola sp. NPDC019693]|uniref:CRISPR-associated helicase Cas3' n=1 Tax=Isoptericola sp. NPDC019693 TaxID=3364009 RepID=UPI003790C8C2